MKMENKKTQKISGIIVLGILIICSILLVYAVSFSTPPTISPNPAYTDNNLTCSWAPSGDTTEKNVSWYKNGVLFSNETVVGNTAELPYQNTSKNQVWTCNVTLNNGTHTTYSSTTRTISNSPPEEPNVYNASGSDIGSFEILLEDETYIYDINSSDPDEDVLFYSVSPASFCTVTNSATGTVTCSPNSSHLGDGNTNGRENITFWAGDTDPYPRQTGHTVTFNITPVDDAPTFSSLFDQTWYEDSTSSYVITGVDEEEDGFNFTMSSDPANSYLVINKTSTTQGTVFFNRTDWKPDWDDVDNYTITITIWETSDNSVNTSDTFELSVLPVQKAPEFTTIGVGNGTQGELFTFVINATDNNSQDTLNFSITTPLCSIDNPWTINTTNSSANATGLINLTLNNSHVVCRNVTISVTDGTVTTDIDINFNITNINDAPEIFNNSYYSGNSGANTNINNLVGATGLIFTYKVNATDIDMLTYAGDTLIYTTNNSNFSINSSTGLISFTPDDTLMGNWSVLVNVTDLNGSKDNATLNISIINNTAPNITEVTTISCNEDSQCLGYITAIDPDPDDNVTFASNNTALFDLEYHNTTAAIYNFTPDNDDVGRYNITINASDLVGAVDNMTFILEINNTNDAPFFDNNLDGTEDTISLGLFVENHTSIFIINATDDDIIHGDSLTFYSVITTGDFDLFTIEKTGNNSARINCTPNSSQTGPYEVNFTVSDSNSARSSQVISFTVYNASTSPTIDYIKPFWNETSNNTEFGFANTSLFTNTTVNINFSENQTIVFDANHTDVDTDNENITFNWYYEGVLNESITPNAGASNTALSMNFTYFMNGTRNISLQVVDNYLSDAWWYWNITVSDVNRAPLLLNNPQNFTGTLSLSSQVTVLNYFNYYDGSQRFIDPDDDVNGNNQIKDNTSDPNEVNHLSYSATSCSVASISISGQDITIAPNSIGTCTVNFTASDTTLNVTSTPVAIEVISVPQSSSGTTTRTNTRTITLETPVPLPQEVQKPVMVKIITPTSITIYKNKTMVLPIIIRNNWEDMLYGITLSATANETNANVVLSEDNYASLYPNQEEKFNLTVTNYREDGPYEIQIIANVTEPEYFDIATILVNAMESTSKGDEVDIKITFAKDLLTQNAECQELNELLDIAQENADLSDYDKAIEYVDLAINGCKYLMSRKELESDKQTPKQFLSMLGENMAILKILGFVFGALILGVVIFEIVEKTREKKKNLFEEQKNR